jgi:pyruvate/2-oxoglutarate dehydrogenase complex dihydrolipoamide dehydrogenase (E3) component
VPDRYDAIVVGAGPAGEVAASRLPKLGLRTALVERELVGGECAYWACIPSKTLLRPPEVRFDAKRTAGTDEPHQDWNDVAAYRDYMIRNLDDSKQVEGYRSDGVDVYKSEATLVAAGRVEVDGQTLETERIILATGSDPRVPSIPGLAEAGYWTNREATNLKQIPASIVILGGGPVGVELGQFVRRFGAQVTIVEKHDRVLAREDPAVGKLIGETLAEEGIDLRLGAEAESVELDGSERVVRLAGGAVLRGEQLLVASGREPRVPDRLDQLSVSIGAKGVEVDERCRAGEGVWAIGDVTGVMPFTHVGIYQARIASADIAGDDPVADYGAIPRVVFSDPEVAAVGLTEAKARERGFKLGSARIRLADAIARPWTYEKDPRGELGLLADLERQVLVGAWAVAPLAGEWIHYAALAIKTKTPLAVLGDTVAQFPSFSEAYLKALERLEPA